MARYLCQTTLSAVLLLGCGTHDDGDGGGAGISNAALVGSWVNGYYNGEETWIFNENGTFRINRTYDLGDGTHPGEDETGKWSVNGDLLTLSWAESGVYSGERWEENARYTTSIAIVDNQLFLETLNRTSGSIESLSGTWRAVEEESESGFEGRETYSGRERETLSLTIVGTDFDLAWTTEWREVEDGEEYGGHDKESLSGFIETEGEGLRLLSPDGYLKSFDFEDSVDGGVADDDDALFEVYSGFRIARDVILLYADSEEQAAELGYAKVQ